MMQACKLKSSVLASTSKCFIRSVTASATAGKVDVNYQIPLKSWQEIPGPSSLPFLGPLHHFLPGGMFQSLNGVALTDKLYGMYGPIVRLDGTLGRPPMLLLSDAESASQILRGENRFPIRPGFNTLTYYRQNLKKDAKKGRPTGLISDHGDLWKELRSAVNPVLMQPKTMKLYTSALDEVGLDMIARMKSLRDEKNMIKGKFDHEMNLWALESIGIVALGCRLGCLDSNLPEDSPAKQLIYCVHELFVIADKLDFRPSIWRLVATPTFKKAMKLYELHDTLSKHFIYQAIEELKTKSKSDDEKGVLEKLLEINEDFAHIMAADMLFAGVDTAANTIASTLYLLAVNPDKQTKLREELRSSEDKRPYLKACLKESLRMMPVVGGNIRVTSKEYNLLGYRIPPDMQVAFGHQNMSLMEEHYPRAKEFLPERWLAEKEDPLYYRNAHPFANSVFGFGVRSCIGRRIAELEMELFTARLVENFHIEWFGPPPRIEQTSLNYFKGPFNFIFNDAPK